MDLYFPDFGTIGLNQELGGLGIPPISNRVTDLVDTILDLSYGRMNFLDQIVLCFRKLFDSFALFPDSSEEDLLTRRDSVHPPKAYHPTECVCDTEPKSNFAPLHGRA